MDSPGLVSVEHPVSAEIARSVEISFIAPPR